MKVIIQCAASKQPDAGKLKTQSGEEVVFVANPKLCSSVPSGVSYVRPDDTWREMLTRYNEEGENRCKLYRAADLYAPRGFPNLYRELADAFGWENFFILSAAWGLIRADFLTPDYNITFSTQSKKKNPEAWRDFKATGGWRDFNHLRDARIEQDEPVHFFGGKDYLLMFSTLVESLPGTKVIHYKSKELDPGQKRHPRFDYAKYDGPEKNRTWHYRAAKDFAAETGLRGEPQT